MDVQRRSSGGGVAASAATSVRPPLGSMQCHRSRWASATNKGDAAAATHRVDTAGPVSSLRQSSSAGAPIALMRRPVTQHAERCALRGSPWAWGDTGSSIGQPATAAAAMAMRPSTRHNGIDTQPTVMWNGGPTGHEALESAEADGARDAKTGVPLSGRDAALLQERDRHRKEVDVAWKRSEKLQQTLNEEQRRHVASRRALLRATTQLCIEQEASARTSILHEAAEERCALLAEMARRWLAHRCAPTAVVAAPIRDSQLLRTLRFTEMQVQRLTDTLRNHNIDIDLCTGGDAVEAVPADGARSQVRPATQGARRRPQHAPSPSW